MSGYRLPDGGRVDRARQVEFSFDGRRLHGLAGDTLASALLGAGVEVIGRSVHLGRPRGTLAAGAEEPNALVALGPASNPELARATTIELFDGLEARGLAGKAPVPAGPGEPSEHRYAHCDVLVVGGGPGGLAAARSAARAGSRVVLVDDKPELGGSLLGAPDVIDGRPAMLWVAAVRDELAAIPDVVILPRTTALARYDANLVLLDERLTDHLPAAQRSGPSHRLWHIRAKQVVLATGSIERLLVFRNNDRPGIMLAGAARTYLHRFGVAAGHRAVVFTTNDSAYAAAVELAGAGVALPVIVDVRPRVSAWGRRAANAGIECLAGRAVVDTAGDAALTSVTIARLDRGRPTGNLTTIECDLLAVSGGWNPALQLYSFPDGRLRYAPESGAFVPAVSLPGIEVIGAASGALGLRAALDSGVMAGSRAAYSAGFPTTAEATKHTVQTQTEDPVLPLWMVPPAGGDPGDLHFVDLQRDATVADIRAAVSAGMRYPEHVKRFTTIGTGNDQGRTSTTNEVGILAELTGQSLATIGPTAFRPPTVPVSFGLMAGPYRGDLFDPIRPTPAHASHAALGALFENVGQWKRAWVYPKAKESFEDAVLRECRAVRENVGMMDVSTLGKIDVQGRDAGVFLDRVYTNTFSNLRVGASRYGLMCRADGMVFDDGTTTRLADDRFFMTTTTGNAAAVLDWLEEWSQTEWPEMEVRFTSVTDQWAATAIAGPRARELLARLAPGLDASAKAFPWMTFREAEVAGMPARIFRISFSGELAYEVNVPAWYGRALWDAVLAAGAGLGLTPYGTEAMHVLRAEKGYFIAGQDSDGTVTPLDLGLDWMVSRKKWFIGRRSLARPAMHDPDRRQLVGFLPEDPRLLVPEGSPLPAAPLGIAQSGTAGHVTSSYRSAALGRTFALGLLAGGHARIGTTVTADVDGRAVRLAVTEPVFWDPENLRRDG